MHEAEQRVGTGQPGRVLMRVQDLHLRAQGRPINVALRAGDMIGLAGLEGQGQVAFLETLAGLRKPVRGRVLWAGGPGADAEVTDYAQAQKWGLAYLPSDRRATGIFGTLSVLDNFAMASLARDGWWGWQVRQRRHARYQAFARQLDIKAQQPHGPITALSGGNQQKVLLARLLALSPQVLLLNDPTRGVDAATRQVLYQVFAHLREQGLCLVVLSTELEEVRALCEDIWVFRDHAMHIMPAPVSSPAAAATAAPDAQRQATDSLMAAMFGRPA